MDIIIGIMCVMSALFGGMLAFYLMLCFIQWISDTIEEGSWKYWWK